LDVPINVDTAPVVYLYNETTIFQFDEAPAKKCMINAKLPAGIVVTPGTPLSVANAAICPLAPDPRDSVVVWVVVDVGVVESCLYVGEPKAELVFKDKFM
jgi:hypothetical protein